MAPPNEDAPLRDLGEVRCDDHLDYTGGICPSCNLEVDDYGNTEAQPFDYCTFPDCGCDGARLCMAGEANKDAEKMNVEGMWSGKTMKQRRAVFDLIERCSTEAESDD